MTIYVDSSALVKMCVDEPGSPEIKQFVSDLVPKEDTTFVTSAIWSSRFLTSMRIMELPNKRTLFYESARNPD